MDPETNPRPSAPGEYQPSEVTSASLEREAAPGQPEVLPSQPETTPGVTEQVSAASVTPAVDPASLAVPQPTAPVQPTDDLVKDDDLPILASDEDLIEKEWVDRAKKVIADTRDDPNRREKEVARLQADYLRKRYGKEIGKNDET